MIKTNKSSKISKTLTIIGCVLLITMAVLHGSGINYVTHLINQSNSESFIKEIFPVLFAHPSIHLIGLASLGILTLFMSFETKKVLFFISSFLIIDSLIAFHLGALIPGVLLIASALCFALSGMRKTT